MKTFGSASSCAPRQSPPSWVLLPLLFLSLGPILSGRAMEDSDCMLCHEDKTLTKTNAQGQAVSLFVDLSILQGSVHRTNTCASCHSDLTDKHPDDNIAAKPVDCAVCHKKQSEDYGTSVHGVAMAEGDASSASCKDCHGNHRVLPHTDPASPLHFRNLTKTCGECHDDVAREVEGSVHGRASAKGEREAATCTDCHSEHSIQKLKGAVSLHISADICSKCHASERINTKFRLPKDRVESFFQSYHGLASQYGSTLAANCASCHGYHLVLPSTDARSTIHTNNLVQTCGECHPGATENFVAGKIHVDVNGATPTDLGGLVNLWVRRVYLVLIVGTIGFMLLHNGLLWLQKVIRLYRHQNRPLLRMNLNQRWQHFTLLASFIVLAVTGFALKWPDSWVAKLLGSHEDFRRWTHRIAGIIMLALGLYHVLYLILTQEGRKLLRDFLPVKKDASDLARNARYLLGRTSERPKVGRFGYTEKMEYWAVVWGTVIMGVTGLMIWFKIDVTQYLPRWAVEVATTVHYYEAILACLAIIVWHFYHVIFDPDVYPANLAFWDGRVSEHWQQEEHPLETDVPRTDTPPSPAEPHAVVGQAPVGGKQPGAGKGAGGSGKEDPSLVHPLL